MTKTISGCYKQKDTFVTYFILADTDVLLTALLHKYRIKSSQNYFSPNLATQKLKLIMTCKIYKVVMYFI